MSPPILACDPQVRGSAEQPRLSGQCRDILAMLRKGPCTARDLASVALKYTGRISDLRRAGYAIAVVERYANGLTLYELGGEPGAT